MEANRLGGPELRADRRKTTLFRSLSLPCFLPEQSPPQPDEVLPVPPESSLASADSEKSACQRRSKMNLERSRLLVSEGESVFPSTHPS